MNPKWYVSALIVALTFLSLVGLQQNSDPNQEIVLQFNNEEVSTCELEAAITLVKNQLLALGVAGIQVHNQEDGKLRITYYSDTDIAIVKKSLSNEDQLISHITENESHKNPKYPTEETPKNYKLDVFEIQQTTDGNAGLNGKFVLELNQASDRFFNPNVYVFSGYVDNYENDILFKVGYKLQTHIAIAVETFLHSIPEVRAGPSTHRDINYC